MILMVTYVMSSLRLVWLSSQKLTNRILNRNQTIKSPSSSIGQIAQIRLSTKASPKLSPKLNQRISRFSPNQERTLSPLVTCSPGPSPRMSQKPSPRPSRRASLRL